MSSGFQEVYFLRGYIPGIFPHQHTHKVAIHLLCVFFSQAVLSGSGILAASTALCQAEERRPREQDVDKRDERGVPEKSMGTRETQHTHTENCNAGVASLTLPHTLSLFS